MATQQGITTTNRTLPISTSVDSLAFALGVIGDSMTLTGHPQSLDDGAEIVIDPERTPRHGDIVVAKRQSDKHPSLRMLWFDGAKSYLKPLNDRYPTLDMPTDTLMIGVVVESVLRNRL
jgi:SOS-response transcriptional repressor LexA